MGKITIEEIEPTVFPLGFPAEKLWVTREEGTESYEVVRRTLALLREIRWSGDIEIIKVTLRKRPSSPIALQRTFQMVFTPQLGSFGEISQEERRINVKAELLEHEGRKYFQVSPSGQYGVIHVKLEDTNTETVARALLEVMQAAIKDFIDDASNRYRWAVESVNQLELPLREGSEVA